MRWPRFLIVSGRGFVGQAYFCRGWHQAPWSPVLALAACRIHRACGTIAASTPGGGGGAFISTGHGSNVCATHKGHSGRGVRLHLEFTISLATQYVHEYCCSGACQQTVISADIQEVDDVASPHRLLPPAIHSTLVRESLRSSTESFRPPHRHVLGTGAVIGGNYSLRYEHKLAKPISR